MTLCRKRLDMGAIPISSTKGSYGKIIYVDCNDYNPYIGNNIRRFIFWI